MEAYGRLARIPVNRAQLPIPAADLLPAPLVSVNNTK